MAADAGRMSRRLVLEFLTEKGDATRAELAAAMGMSFSAISTLVGQLRDEGLIEEVEVSAETIPGFAARRGRRPVVLRRKGQSTPILGIDIGHAFIRVGIATTPSSVIDERVRQIGADSTAEQTMDMAVALAQDLVRSNGMTLDDLTSCSVGVPSPVDSATGVIDPQTIVLEWAGLAPGAVLSRALDTPTYVDNDSNLGALAEATLGAGVGCRTQIYVKIGYGIGAGLVIDGSLYSGANGAAGELGHVQIKPDGELCRCGARGCLETVASAERIVASLEAISETPLTLAEGIALVERGDRAAMRIFADAGRAVGRSLTSICTILNPEAVVVGGDMGAATGTMVAQIRDALTDNSLPSSVHNLRVVPAAFGARSGLIGALINARLRGRPGPTRQLL